MLSPYLSPVSIAHSRYAFSQQMFSHLFASNIAMFQSLIRDMPFRNSLIFLSSKLLSVSFNRSFAICLFATIHTATFVQRPATSFNRSFAICLFATLLCLLCPLTLCMVSIAHSRYAFSQPYAECSSMRT